MQLAGRRIDHLRPFERVAAGIGRTFQSIELYDDMTDEENVARRSAGAARGRSTRCSTSSRLSDVADVPAGQLSQGTRQLVSVARALVGRPQVLLLDEPAAGLDPSESTWLGDRLRDVRDWGASILLVDHDMHWSSASATRSTCWTWPADRFGNAGGDPQRPEGDSRLPGRRLPHP